MGPRILHWWKSELMAEAKTSSKVVWLDEFDIDQSWHDQRETETKAMEKARGTSFLTAWYRRSKPYVDHYLAGISSILHRQARGEAGGRSHPRKISELDKAALSGLTAEACKALSDEDLVRLHALTHTMAGKEPE